MTIIVGLPKSRPIVEEDGFLTPESRVALLELEARIPIYGSGSPEGEVESLVGATYYDIDASTGSIIYVKTQDNIGGDRSKGWTLA